MKLKTIRHRGEISDMDIEACSKMSDRLVARLKAVLVKHADLASDIEEIFNQMYWEATKSDD